jgi:hypothetical protein
MSEERRGGGADGPAGSEGPRRPQHQEPPPQPTEQEAEPESEGLASSIVSHLQAVAEPVANAMAPMASALGSVFEAAGQAFPSPADLAGRIHRAVSPEPLASLYDVFPEARQAAPRELGLHFVPAEEILGTAVAGYDQRGTDFLPLRQFRGENWNNRWKRILDANERLKPLPPVDLVKFGGGYWVVDGHNRVGAVLRDNGAGVDAMVVELVPLDGQASERPVRLLSLLGEGQEMRAAARGLRPAIGIRYAEQASSEEPEPRGGAEGSPSSAEQRRPRR